MNKEKISLKLEIEARNIVLKKLLQVQKQLQNQAEKQLNKRKAIVEKTREYKNLDEVQELWGYGCIDDEELQFIKEAFETGQNYIDNNISKQEAAVTVFNRIIENIAYEIRCFEFELLPPEEQAKKLRQKQEVKK